MEKLEQIEKNLKKATEHFFKFINRKDEFQKENLVKNF